MDEEGMGFSVLFTPYHVSPGAVSSTGRRKISKRRSHLAIAVVLFLQCVEMHGYAA